MMKFSWSWVLALLLSLGASSTALAIDRATWIERSQNPRKVLNIKFGAALEWLHDSYNPNVISYSPRFVGQIGLQTAWKPWMLEVSFYTNVAFEVSTGLFWPFWRIGYGSLVVTAFPYFKATTEKEAGAGGELLTEVSETFRVGAGLEYLMYTGHLGFFVEVRQSFIEPVGTMIVTGVDISPLLWMLFRDN